MFLGLKFEVSQMYKHGIAMKKKVKIKCMKFELEHWFATFMPWITIYMHTRIPMMEVILKWHLCKLVNSLVIKKSIQTQFEILVCLKSTCTWNETFRNKTTWSLSQTLTMCSKLNVSEILLINHWYDVVMVFRGH